MKKVLSNNILAVELQQKELDSGLVLADTVESEKTRFKVEAIGEQVAAVRVGDVVYVPSKVGKTRPELVMDGVTYTVLSETNVVIVENE